MNKDMISLYLSILGGEYRFKQSRWSRIKGRITGCYKINIINFVSVNVLPQPVVFPNGDQYIIPGYIIHQKSKNIYSLSNNNIDKEIQIIKDNGKALKYKERLYFNNNGYFFCNKEPTTLVKRIWYQLTKPRCYL